MTAERLNYYDPSDQSPETKVVAMHTFARQRRNPEALARPAMHGVELGHPSRTSRVINAIGQTAATELQYDVTAVLAGLGLAEEPELTAAPLTYLTQLPPSHYAAQPAAELLAA